MFLAPYQLKIFFSYKHLPSSFRYYNNIDNDFQDHKRDFDSLIVCNQSVRVEGETTARV